MRKRALDKLKRVGQHKVLYINSPLGERMGKVLPRIDMSIRLLFNSMVEMKISYDFYIQQKNGIVDYNFALDSWCDNFTEEAAITIKKKAASYREFSQPSKAKRKDLWFNTETALDFFACAIRIDKVSRIMIIGMRQGIISPRFAQKEYENCLEIINNLENEAIKLGGIVWKHSKK